MRPSHRRALVASVVVLGTFASSDGEAQSQQQLFGSEPQVWVAPGRLFSVEVPPGWQVTLTNDPYDIRFVPQQPGDAFLSVRRMTVPEGAKSKQLMLNAIDKRLKKLPLFKEGNRRDVFVAGRKGAAVIGTYAHQGNIDFPRAVEEIYVVVGPEAFIFHFESFAPAAADFAEGLALFYRSFVARPPADDGTGQPTEPMWMGSPDQMPTPDKVAY